MIMISMIIAILPDSKSNGTNHHNSQSHQENTATRHLIDNRHEDEHSQHIPQTHHKHLNQQRLAMNGLS